MMKLLQQISYNNSKLLDLSKENEKFQNLLKFNDSNENIVKIISYNSQLFLITQKQEVDYKGYIKSFEYNGYILKEQQFFSKKPFIKMICNNCYNENPIYLKNIFIVDFISESMYRDKGYGTLIMNELITYAKQLKVKYISGKLSFIDIGISDDDEKYKEKRKRLYHFYSKFGFTIDEHINKYGIKEKTIKLDLTKL